MTSKKEFNELTVNNKQDWINKLGRHVAIGTSKEFNYLLYELCDFLIEVQCNKKLNRIEDVMAISDDKDLDKYIDTEVKLNKITG